MWTQAYDKNKWLLAISIICRCKTYAQELNIGFTSTLNNKMGKLKKTKRNCDS